MWQKTRGVFFYLVVLVLWLLVTPEVRARPLKQNGPLPTSPGARSDQEFEASLAVATRAHQEAPTERQQQRKQVEVIPPPCTRLRVVVQVVVGDSRQSSAGLSRRSFFHRDNVAQRCKREVPEPAVFHCQHGRNGHLISDQAVCMSRGRASLSTRRNGLDGRPLKSSEKYVRQVLLAYLKNKRLAERTYA